jgi:RNA polymerase sigma factor (sigma-70 family)
MASKMTENKIDSFFKKEYKKLVHYVQKNMEQRYADVSPEDIVQDVALSLLDKLNIDAQIENLAGYIYRSLRNKILDNKKKKRIDFSIENFEKNIIEPVSEETDEIDYISEIEPETLREAIQQLNDEDKYIITITHFEGKSFQQLSKELKTPVGTLLSRKHRAQAKLARIIEANQMN